MLDTALGKEKVLEWLVDKNVLRISLEGHIDQSQYCDKIRTVVQFIGDKLSADELTLLWKLQVSAFDVRKQFKRVIFRYLKA